MASRDKSNDQDVITGTQDLNTGLVHHAITGEVILDPIEDEDNVIQVDKIGAYERRVYADGHVAARQVGPANANSGEIVTPVPLPGEKQDQLGTGQVDDVKVDTSKTATPPAKSAATPPAKSAGK